MVFCVKHVVFHATALQKLGKVFGAFHRGGTHQHWLVFGHAFDNVVHHSGEFGFLGFVHQVGEVFTLVGAVGGDGHHVEFVDLVQLGGFCLGGTSHTCEFVVQTEVVLQGDGGQGLVFVFDLHALFGLNGLVHAFVVAATSEDTTREFIHDEDFPTTNDVVLVAGE